MIGGCALERPAGVLSRLARPHLRTAAPDHRCDPPPEPARATRAARRRQRPTLRGAGAAQGRRQRAPARQAAPARGVRVTIAARHGPTAAPVTVPEPPAELLRALADRAGRADFARFEA